MSRVCPCSASLAGYTPDRVTAIVCQPQTAVGTLLLRTTVAFAIGDKNHSVAIIDIRAGINFRISALNAEFRPVNSKILIDG
jgi:hypothetical protein